MRLTRQLISIIFADSLRSRDRQLVRRDIDRWRLSGSRGSKVPTHLFTSSCEACSRRRVIRAIHHPDTGDTAATCIFQVSGNSAPQISTFSETNGTGPYAGYGESGSFVGHVLRSVFSHASTGTRIFGVLCGITYFLIPKASWNELRTIWNYST